MTKMNEKKIILNYLLLAKIKEKKFIIIFLHKL